MATGVSTVDLRRRARSTEFVSTGRELSQCIEFFQADAAFVLGFSAKRVETLEVLGTTGGTISHNVMLESPSTILRRDVQYVSQSYRSPSLNFAR